MKRIGTSYLLVDPSMKGSPRRGCNFDGFAGLCSLQYPQ